MRAALAKNHVTVPAYLAGPGDMPAIWRRAGRPAAPSPERRPGSDCRDRSGGARDTINRLETQVQGWLEELDPLGNTRFAMIPPSHPRDVVAMRAPR